MKKNIIKLFLIISLLFPFSVKAAPTGSLSCSSSGSVTVGNTITVSVRGSSSDAMWDTTMSYDSSKLQKVGGSDEHSIGNDFTTSTSYTYTFKAINEGSAWVKVNAAIADYEGNKAYPSSSCNINVSAPSQSSSSVSSSSSSKTTDSTPKSSDNNLNSLSVEGKDISPEFNKDTLEYSLELDTDTTKITINAEKSDSKASLTGTGEKDIEEGFNKFEIVVTAENGSSKTYVINVIVKDKNPIEVKINNKKYTVVKKAGALDAPEGFEETKIKINNEEVDAYKNVKTKYIIVTLTDEKGNSSWYIYNKKKNTYTKYVESKSNSLRLIVLNISKKNIPSEYKITTFKLNGEKVSGYSNGTDFKIVYGMNIETGKKSLYVYDSKENTLQRYNKTSKDYSNLAGDINNFDNIKIILVALISLLFIFFITIISLMRKNMKLKEDYIQKIDKFSPIKKDKTEVEYKNIKDETIKLSKKDIKKELKEEKKKLKEERKTFLDE